MNTHSTESALRCEGCGAWLADADLMGGSYRDGHLAALSFEKAMEYGTPYLPCGPVVRQVPNDGSGAQVDGTAVIGGEDNGG